MATPFLGEIKIISFNFAPKGWALCNGQFLPINQNQALFSLLGTTYGGNGQTTFALPDLRGRVPMHVGSGHTRANRRPGSPYHRRWRKCRPQPFPSGRCKQRRRDQSPTPRPPTSPRPVHRQAGDRRNCTLSHLQHANSRTATLAPQAISNVGGSQPHKKSALSGAQLHHRAAGHLPLPELTARTAIRR